MTRWLYIKPAIFSLSWYWLASGYAISLPPFAILADEEVMRVGGTTRYFETYRVDFYGRLSGGLESVLEAVVRHHKSNRPFVLVDVGAGPDPFHGGACFVCEAVQTVVGCNATRGDRFFAFEPDPAQFDALIRKLAFPEGGASTRPWGGAECLSLFPVAASDRSGAADLLIAHAPNTNTLDWERLGRSINVDEGWGWEDGKKHLSVPTMALDDLLGDGRLEYVDLLKVDTEGHDAFVLLGARTVLAEGRVGVVVAEVSDKMNRFTYAARNRQVVTPADEYFREADVTLRGMVEFMASLGYHAYLLGSQGGLRIDGRYWDSDDLEFCRDPGRLGFGPHPDGSKLLPCHADVAFVHAATWGVEGEDGGGWRRGLNETAEGAVAATAFRAMPAVETTSRTEL